MFNNSRWGLSGLARINYLRAFGQCRRPAEGPVRGPWGMRGRPRMRGRPGMRGLAALSDRWERGCTHTHTRNTNTHTHTRNTNTQHTQHTHTHHMRAHTDTTCTQTRTQDSLPPDTCTWPKGGQDSHPTGARGLNRGSWQPKACRVHF